MWVLPIPEPGITRSGNCNSITQNGSGTALPGGVAKVLSANGIAPNNHQQSHSPSTSTSHPNSVKTSPSSPSPHESLSASASGRDEAAMIAISPFDVEFEQLWEATGDIDDDDLEDLRE